MDSTIQVSWQTLHQATLLQAAATDHYLNYSTNWTETTEPYAAQNPAQWPSFDMANRATTAVSIDTEANQIRLRAIISNANNEVASCILWGWDGNGAPLDLVTVTVTAGQALCSTHPVSQATLADFYYADTMAITQNNSGAVVRGGTTDGIVELRLDVTGCQELLWTTDVSTAADCIGIFKYL